MRPLTNPCTDPALSEDLIVAFARGDTSPADLGTIHNIPLMNLLDWWNLPDVKHAIATLKDMVTTHAEFAALTSRYRALETLATIAADLSKPEPARKAAGLLARLSPSLREGAGGMVESRPRSSTPTPAVPPMVAAAVSSTTTALSRDHRCLQTSAHPPLIGDDSLNNPDASTSPSDSPRPEGARTLPGCAARLGEQAPGRPPLSSPAQRADEVTSQCIAHDHHSTPRPEHRHLNSRTTAVPDSPGP